MNANLPGQQKKMLEIGEVSVFIWQSITSQHKKGG
jgi:hypothetical protein